MGGETTEVSLSDVGKSTEIVDVAKSGVQNKEKMQEVQNVFRPLPPGMIEIKIGDKAIIYVEPTHSAVRQAEGMLAVFKAELPPEEKPIDQSNEKSNET